MELRWAYVKRYLSLGSQKGTKVLNPGLLPVGCLLTMSLRESCKIRLRLVTNQSRKEMYISITLLWPLNVRYLEIVHLLVIAWPHQIAHSLLRSILLWHLSIKLADVPWSLLSRRCWMPQPRCGCSCIVHASSTIWRIKIDTYRISKSKDETYIYFLEFCIISRWSMDHK